LWAARSVGLPLQKPQSGLYFMPRALGKMSGTVQINAGPLGENVMVHCTTLSTALDAEGGYPAFGHPCRHQAAPQAKTKNFPQPAFAPAAVAS
jgi:hypothetical protein